MNITSVKFAPGAFANGFSYFCTNHGGFFSVQGILDDDARIEFCPYCGEKSVINNTNDLLCFCKDFDTDPVNFYEAFPQDEPIPNSRAGATPKQVEWIIGCVISDRYKNIPVTIESLAAQLGYSAEIVKKVFEELHITETGGKK